MLNRWLKIEFLKEEASNEFFYTEPTCVHLFSTIHSSLSVTISKQAPYYVQRIRLISKLMDENRAKLMLIAASAGFGKTTLAAKWARTHSDEVAWLSLENLRCIFHIPHCF
ncbi:hypothetical protein MHH60_00035 [Paenibacillus sp. FSL H7-0716]